MANFKNKVHCSEIERQSRVNEVAKAILNGFSNRKILLQFLTESYKWDVIDRTLDGYIADAKDLLSSINENEVEFEKTLALNRLDSLYNLNFKIHDFRECRNIIESRSKLLGISSPEKIQLSSKDDKPLFTIITQSKETAEKINKIE